MTAGEFFKEARIKAGLSQVDVAKKFGWTSGQQVSNAERGLSQFPIRRLKALCHLLGVDPREGLKIYLDDLNRRETKKFHRGGIK
jgi:transcriptional regulator with XRE-family HTH domain